MGNWRSVNDDELLSCAAYLAKPIKQSVLFETLLDVLGDDAGIDEPVSVCRETPGAAGRLRLEARVLLVEDNPVNRKLAERILEKLGCDTTTAENGIRALEMLERKDFDIVFMDVQMPEMDGFTATRHIREDGRWPNVPIIAMTAHALKGDRERCLEAGMDDYLSKPLSRETIQEVIQKWSGGRGEALTIQATTEPSDIKP